ncbi:MAG TPA: hypothetical protein VN930_07010 [Xanthobacteraceae bacterium]|nr:hypothetical protein [Xanthobacteraceae bacterium]
MWFVFAALGLAIVFSVAADQVHNSAVLWLGASVAWLGIIWVGLAKA